MRDEPDLVRVMACLSPLHEAVVVVGGTAQRLFRAHPLARDPGFELLSTVDIDLAAPLELGVRCASTDDALRRLVAGGFRECPTGGYGTCTYQHAESVLYVQFIAPMRGDGLTRAGDHDRVLTFAGLHAEKLRTVDLLLHAPWELSVGTGDATVTVRVVHPVAYVVQKLLLLGKRDPAKRAKDVVYVHDTLLLFRDSLDALAEQTGPSLPRLTTAQLRALEEGVRECSVARRASVEEAEAIVAEQRSPAPSAEVLAATCEHGLRVLLREMLPDRNR